MAKITRKLMKLFGSSAGVNQIGQFGSLAAAAPTYVNDGDPDTIQALANYLTGWYGAVVGSNSPAIQDMNAVCYLYARQLCYLFQAGIAEWSATTTYYIGSFASDGLGGIYYSLIDNNLNSALTVSASWARVNNAPPTIVSLSDSPVTIVANANYEVHTTTGAVSLQLPNSALISSGFSFSVKDIDGDAVTNAITITRFGAEQIEGYAANYSCLAAFGSWKFQFDGTKWWIV